MSGWIDHDGGHCPIPEDAWIDVQLRGDKGRSWVEQYDHPELASAFCPLPGQGDDCSNWVHDGSAFDILRYKIVKAPRP